ncbi:MAG: hypothetical protein M0C28_39220 [Candidatus Moduliflexus flocculans]|nr:hypothetical protein [Candidatus Moduliflexus flocculans]
MTWMASRAVARPLHRQEGQHGQVELGRRASVSDHLALAADGRLADRDLLLVHVAEHAVVVGVGVGDLGDLEAGEVLLVEVPLEAFGRRPGLVLGDVVDLAGRAGLVVGGRDVAPGPVAGAAVAGVGGHDRAVGRGARARRGWTCSLRRPKTSSPADGPAAGLAAGGRAMAGQDDGQGDAPRTATSRFGS